jgi:group I intron endonuclease
MIIYKIINLINGKYYIGKDESNNPNYFGSGKLIKMAIKKYGIQNFKKEILECCKDSTELSNRERKIVNESMVKDPMSYNIAIGGCGGNLLAGATDKERQQWKNKISKSTSGEKNGMFGKSQSDEGKQKISDNNKRPDHGNNNRKCDKNPFYNKNHTQTSLDKLSKSTSGSNNPRARMIRIDGIEYDCIKYASDVLGINHSTISNRLRSKNFNHYQYL